MVVQLWVQEVTQVEHNLDAEGGEDLEKKK